MLPNFTTTRSAVPPPASIVSIHGAVGDKVAVGAELVVIETEADAEQKAEAKPAAAAAMANSLSCSR